MIELEVLKKNLYMKTCNMNIQTIIKVLNEFINNKYPNNTGKFILRRTITNTSRMVKTLKQFDNWVCFHYDKNNIITPLRICHSTKCSNETEKEKAILELDYKTVLAILEFITDSSKLNSLIDGTYRNPTTEDINRD